MPASASERPIVSFGEVLWDVFPDGERLGGCAANVAFHVAMLRCRSTLVSRVGADERGRSATRELGRVGVDTELVQVDEVEPTGVVRVTFVDGQPEFSIVHRAAWDRVRLTAGIMNAAARSRAFVFGTLAQRTADNASALFGALDACAADCVRVLDMNLRPPFISRDAVARSIDAATIVKLNEAERHAVGELMGVRDVTTWLLRECGVSLVAVTLGSRGSVLSRRDERVEQAPPRVAEGGDAVGAGDAFTAVLARGFARSSSLQALGEAANRYAGWVASHRGAMPPAPVDLVEQIPL